MEYKNIGIEKRTFGAIYSGVDVRDYKLACGTAPRQFPAEFELPTVNRIKNQGMVGSCVAHALSSIVEYYNATQRGDNTEMSTGYIYGNRSNSDHKKAGMVIRDALDIVLKYGDVPKSEFPENVETPKALMLFQERASENLYAQGKPNRISRYCRINTLHEAKMALYSGVPLLMAMDWYADMKVVDGILKTDYIGCEGGHCMFIFGWNHYGWKVQNSWGKDWGDDGKFILPYEHSIAECWAVMDDIIGSAQVKKPFSSQIGKFFAKIINAVCSLFQRNK